MSFLASYGPYWASRTVSSAPFVLGISVANNQTIHLRIHGVLGNPLEADVDWGDGSPIQTVTIDSPIHTYVTGGTYTISITGNVPGFGSSLWPNQTWLRSINQWGDVGLVDLTYACYLGNIAGINVEVPNNIPSTVTTLEGMFSGAQSFNRNISSWDTSSVTNMNSMFAGCYAFNQPIGNWDVSSVTDMRYMFSSCTSFNQPIGNWNVSSVTDMSYMFFYASVFNQPIGNWDVSSVTDMSYMFWGCTAFNQPIGNWDVSSVTNMLLMLFGCVGFNQPIGNWDVSSVTNMTSMLAACYAFDQPIGNWNTSAVTTMAGMFSGTQIFNQDISSWDVSSVTNMSDLFRGAYAFNQDISSWDVSSVTNMSSMFRDARAFNQPIGNWDVSSVTNMDEMFRDAWVFNRDLSEWCVTNIVSPPPNFALFAYAWTLPKPVWGTCPPVEGDAMLMQISVTNNETIHLRVHSVDSNMLNATVNWGDGSPLQTVTLDSPTHTYVTGGTYTISITGNVPGLGSSMAPYPTWLRGISQWGDTGLVDLSYACFNGSPGVNVELPTNLPPTVTNLTAMLAYCTAFNRDISNWDVSSVTNMSSMFQNCTAFNQPLNNWNVSSVTNMGGMFGSCTVFNQPLNNWNTSAVTTMQFMFYECHAFNQNINNWNVSSVTNMRLMFSGCTSFNQPVGNWDVSSVTDMRGLFSNSPLFNQNISTWNVSSATLMEDMFKSCTAFNQNISTWNVSSVTAMGGMFDGCTTFNQPIGIWDVSSVVAMDEMFRGCTTFNQDISSWDVSSVGSMDRMFYNASTFNKDLSGWCVQLISTAPPDFSTGATGWTLPKPVWGTCPSNSPVDPYFNNVTLLLHLNGTDGSTSFVDSSTNTKTVSANGNAQISTVQSKFGGASALLDGTGDYLTSNDNVDYEFGSSDFTVEFWMRLTSSARQGLISKGAAGDWASFDISTDGTGSRSIQVRCSSGSGWSIDFFAGPVPAWSLNTWHHVALVRNGNTFTLYIDGTSRGNGTAAISLMNNTAPLQIGRSNFWAADATGNIDEVRITKGVARYTTDFMVPDAPFPDQ